MSNYVNEKHLADWRIKWPNISVEVLVDAEGTKGLPSVVVLDNNEVVARIWIKDDIVLSTTCQGYSVGVGIYSKTIYINRV